MFQRGNKDKKTVQPETPKEKLHFEFENEEMMYQVYLTDLNTINKETIADIRDCVDRNRVEIADTFYAKILEVPMLKAIIEKHSTVERLKQTIIQHILSMFEGHMTEEDLQKRKKVAMVHHHIQLVEKWYMSAFQHLENVLCSILEKDLDKKKQRNAVEALSKIISFEQQLVLDSYGGQVIKKEREENEKKQKIRDNILDISNNLVAVATQTDASVSELVTHANELNNHMEDTSTQASQTEVVAKSGNTHMQGLLKNMGTIRSSADIMKNHVLELSSASKEIKNIVFLVEDIANQINMLALNASIEAAKAGEHGRGFAVVAEEVRKLSDDTKKSVEKINSLVNKSSNITEQVVTAIEDVENYVQKGSTNSEQTSDSFDGILSSVGHTNITISQIKGRISEFVEVIEEIGRTSKLITNSVETLNEASKDLGK